MKNMLKRARRVLFADIIAQHQKDRDFAYFLSLPDSTIRITHRGRVINFYIPDADRDTVQRVILESRSFFEIDILTKIRALVPMKGRGVADIGANIGNHSVFFTAIAGARSCSSFEPNPYTNSLLQKNVSINNLDQLIEVHAVGIASDVGQHSFDRVRMANIGSNSFKKGGDDGIAFAPLDTFEFDDLALLKIDVEGMADEVLKGSERVIREHRPAIFIELIGEEAARARPILAEMGYVETEKLPGSNFLFRHSAN